MLAIASIIEVGQQILSRVNIVTSKQTRNDHNWNGVTDTMPVRNPHVPLFTMAPAVSAPVGDPAVSSPIEWNNCLCQFTDLAISVSVILD